jgi:hypothetical protein
VIALAGWDSFARWNDTRWKKRFQEYDAMKENRRNLAGSIGRRIGDRESAPAGAEMPREQPAVA